MAVFVDEKGDWQMEGLRWNDPTALTSADACEAFIHRVGFLPLMRDAAYPVSLEAKTVGADWWTGDPARDPWVWRGALAAREGIVYGKFLGGKATFVAKEKFGLLATVRREGRSLQDWFEDGRLPRKALHVMEALEGGAAASLELKRAAGFRPGGERGFEGIAAELMRMTFLCVTGFARKRAAAGHEYGWPASVYAAADTRFTEDEADGMTYASAAERARALEEIVAGVMACCAGAERDRVIAMLRG